MSFVTEILATRTGKVNLSDLSRQTGIPYRDLYHSLGNGSDRKRDLRDWELLAVCKALGINPISLQCACTGQEEQ